MTPKIELRVNGRTYTVDVDPYDSLNKVLRERLGLTGTKRGCDYGGCGSCTVLVNERSVYSCMFPAMRAERKEITTIEGLERDGEMNPLQKAFVEADAFQCGYCTPGLVMAAHALLLSNPSPGDEEILDAISGNLCRCGVYPNIMKAIKKAMSAYQK
jgi:aerobic-type carbon monoxide dehydrogenase small subunit (CoxS/CutS family)